MTTTEHDHLSAIENLLRDIVQAGHIQLHIRLYERDLNAYINRNEVIDQMQELMFGINHSLSSSRN